MGLLNTNIGPERVQVFDQPLGTVQVAGAATSSVAILISSALAGAPVNQATPVTSLTQFVSLFGDISSVTDVGYYAVKGFFDNAGTGPTAYIVNVGQGTEQVTQVVAVADVSGSLNSTYFTLTSAFNRTQYYVWLSVAGAGVNPLISGATGIQVSVATNATATTVATAIATALSSVSDFTVSHASTAVTITDSQGGPATLAADGASPTGFAITIPTLGARPAASAYIGDAVAGTGLRALDIIDLVGMITVPGLPLETAYLVQSAVVDYSQVVRADFGSALSTSFSLLAPPVEVTTSQTDSIVVSAATISAISGSTVTFSGTPDLTSVTAGMVVDTTGGLFKTVITAVNSGMSQITVAVPGSLMVSQVVNLAIPSAITYKDSVINTPSRVSAWYFNNVLVPDAAIGSTDLITVDPVCHVAGVISRIDANTSIGGPSHAPAGQTYAAIAGISGLSLALSERVDAAPLRLDFINRIQSFPGRGFVVFGGYTNGGSSVTADEQLIQVMRTLQFIKASLEPGLMNFLWENFSPATQAQIAGAIQSFLRQNIYLFPAGLPETSQFNVVSVTPSQDDLNQGLLTVIVQVRPNQAIRFIEIDLQYPLPSTATT